jgi:glycosyltransferase involved in cell wall biosynthesis
VTIAASDFHVLERKYVRRATSDDRRTLEEIVEGVHMRWLWASAYDRNNHQRISNWLTFARSVVRERWRDERPHVVLGSSPHLFAALAAWRVAKALDVPFVLEVRDLWLESLRVGATTPGPGYWGLWLLSRFLYRGADRIVVLAKGVQAYLESLGVPAERLVYVPNGADLQAFGASAPRTHDPLRLVYAGAHGPANGLETVVSAAAMMRDDNRVRFVLFGDGPAKASLIAMARSQGLSNIEFHDPVPKTKIPDVLASCDAGLMVLKDLPLFSFGVSPNKLFDYWGAGLPVICNVPGEVGGWVRAAGGGLQASDSSARALVSAIDALVRLPAERRRALGESGRAWMKREHDRPVLAARLDAAIRPLLRRDAA